MQQALSPDQAAQRVNQALESMERETSALKEIIAAFRPLKAAQASFKAGLPVMDSPRPKMDPGRLTQGEPLAAAADFLAGLERGPLDYLRQAARALLPALEQGLPVMAPSLRAIDSALAGDAWDAAACLESLLKGERAAFEGQARQAGLDPASLEFVLAQLVKPLLEKRAESLGRLLQGRDWSQGSCPVCGALPEMAILQESGERWLRCSLCAHHWRFKRTACPVCANEDQDKLEFFFAEGRERERVDACRQCGKYLVSLDVRGLDAPPVWEVAALGLVHLDLLAQEQGLAPAAWCAWNQVR